MTVPNPVLVEVTRGAAVESRHRGAAVIADSRGQVVAAWGDVDRPLFPRSAVKPFQVLPLLESGAADRFAVGDEELALACSSHGGEPDHVQRVGAWLARIGLGPADLACGPHPPLSEEAAKALIREGREPSPLHNNCSGKHAGFLTTALHLGAPVLNYTASDHPVQRAVRHVLAEMGDVDLSESPVAVDGCGAPVVAMPLAALARAFARLADAGALARARASVVRRVIAAMTGYPYLVAGRGRFDTDVIEAGAGALVVKGGAEGVYAAALVRLGLGIALKIDDGAKRAAECAMATLLVRFADLDDRTRIVLANYREAPVRNTQGVRVGSVHVAPGWLD